MSHRIKRAAVLAAIAVVLAAGGCADAPGDAPAGTAQDSTQDRDAAPDMRIAVLDTDGLREQATAALRERRIHAPAGDNAVEYYLALRDKAPGDASVGAAVVELQPYLLIAVEQALARGEAVEAGRLLALMARVDPDAPALPRLRYELATVEQARVDAEAQARADAAAARLLAERQARTVAQSATPTSTEPPARAGQAASAISTPDTSVTPNRPTPASPVAGVASPPPQAVPDTGISASSLQVPAKPIPQVPRLVRDAPPRYPMIAMSRRIEGQVKVGFTIEPDGSVSSVRLLSAQPAGVFEEAAIEAARRWRFEPGGQSVTTTRTLNFALPRGG